LHGWIPRRLPREDLRRLTLGVVERSIPEPLRVRVVVERARVPRDAVDDLEAHVRVLDPDRDELREVARAHPDRETPLVLRERVHVADAHAEHAQTVLVGVEAPERLAED